MTESYFKGVPYLKPGGHECNADLPSDGYGSAIDSCYENMAGEFWAGNGEYGSQVNYCPFCGAKAPSPVSPSSPTNRERRMRQADARFRASQPG